MRTAKLLLLSLGIALSACDYINPISSENGDTFFNDEEDCDCDKGNIIKNESDKPQTAEVVIRVSSNNGNPVKLKIYKGPIDRGKVLEELETSQQRNIVELPVNQKYTYAAEYQRNGNTIIVPIYSYLDCKINECNGRQCYMISNNIIDLGLKY
ncbi:MAG: hypothetical protein MJZ61_05650 [Bacteroidales bacterium]|nr:hypothetical protein [Bacteroidales bacterium]